MNTIEILSGNDPKMAAYFAKMKDLANDCDDFYGIDWEMVEKNAKDSGDQFVCSLQNDNVEGFILISSLSFAFAPTCFTSSFVVQDMPCSLILLDLLDVVKTHFPTVLIDWEDHYPELIASGFESCDLTFTYNDDQLGTYVLPNFRPYALPSYALIFKQQIDQFYARGESDVLKTYIKSREELADELYPGHYPDAMLYQKEFGQVAFLGFTYFDCDEIRERYHRNACPEVFITAYANGEKDTLVGVLKIVKEESFWSLAYIDVHFNYRRMGIATKLYQALNDFLTETDVLVSSRPSPMGKKANVRDLRKSLVTKCEMYEDRAYFESKRKIPQTV